MASKSMQPSATSAKSILTPVMTLEGHEPVTRGRGTIHRVSSICYFPDGEQMISGSMDKTARRWDLRAGKEIEEAREVHEWELLAVAVSRDGRWVVTSDRKKLKVCEVETGIVRTLEFSRVETIDISADSTLFAGGSWDNTRIWSLDTGKLVAGPFESPHLQLGTIRLSHNSKKLAVKSVLGRWLEVWDVKTQKLDVSVGNDDNAISAYSPMFWTTKDKTIVSTLNFKDDMDTVPEDIRGFFDMLPKTIYEFNVSTLQTVGAPFEGHTRGISGLALSFDCALLASASSDYTIKLWAFESRQLLASFEVHNPDHLLLSPNSHQLAYTTRADSDSMIYICDIPSEILASIEQPNTSALKKDLLNSDATRRAVRRRPVISPVTPLVPRSLRPSPTIHPQERDFLRYLRKLLPSRTNAVPPVRNDQPRDPLDFPATSPLPPNRSLSARATTQAPVMNPHENSPPPITQSSTTASTTFKARLHDLWTGHALPPIVDVPLAQAKERNAAAGAPPKNNEDWIPDEDYVPSRPPSPNFNSQPPPPPAVQINTGEHGSGRLCSCF